MLLDARTLPDGTRFEADIAIVGAGPAGLVVARELMDSGLTVIVLEGGGLRPDAGRQDVFHGSVADTRHPPAALYRVRALGGTSTLWGGRCVPLDPLDLEERPWIPHSGWPIRWLDLCRWYPAALEHCEAGPDHFTAAEALGPDAPPLVEGLSGGDLDDTGVERFSPPTDFGRHLRKDLESSRSVTVLLPATVTRIHTDDMRRRVTGLLAAPLPGRRIEVAAERVILAAGGLETARLLLANDLGGAAAGRFYMCHVEGKAAEVVLSPDARVAFSYERDRDGVYVRRRFTVPAEVQRRDRLTNVVLRFEPPVIADPSHGDPVLSAMWVSRTFLKREYARKLDSFGYRGAGRVRGPRLVMGHAANILKGAPRLLGFTVDWTRRHVLATRKLPYVAVRGRDGTYSLDYNAEQTPNPDSRVRLGDDTDAFGLPRLAIDWRVDAIDIEGVLAAHRLLAKRLEETGRGRLRLDEDAIRHGFNAIGGHHIGTARMATDPSKGVVDGDGKVFGMDNLFVTGAAIFPTSGHANPTLTLVALAVRLATTLRRLAARPSPREMAQAAE